MLTRHESAPRPVGAISFRTADEDGHKRPSYKRQGIPSVAALRGPMWASAANSLEDFVQKMENRAPPGDAAAAKSTAATSNAAKLMQPDDVIIDACTPFGRTDGPPRKALTEHDCICRRPHVLRRPGASKRVFA